MELKREGKIRRKVMELDKRKWILNAREYWRM